MSSYISHLALIIQIFSKTWVTVFSVEIVMKTLDHYIYTDKIIINWIDSEMAPAMYLKAGISETWVFIYSIEIVLISLGH